MAKKEVKVVEIAETKADGVVKSACVPKISPLTENFSNGEVNILKDKINEIIARS